MPRSWTGKLTAVACALVGIPILLLYLALVGSCLAGVVKRTMCCKNNSERNSSSNKQSSVGAKCCRMCDQDRARCRMEGHGAMATARRNFYPPTNQTSFPIWLCVLLLLAYVCAGAAAFCIIRPSWHFVDSFFFCFAALATIGISLDDGANEGVSARPLSSHPNLSGTSDDDPTFVMCCTLYLLIGLALVSMCINLIGGFFGHRTAMLMCLARGGRGSGGSNEDGLLNSSGGLEEDPPS